MDTSYILKQKNSDVYFNILNYDFRYLLRVTWLENTNHKV
jgi:hypothetical protein